MTRAACSLAAVLCALALPLTIVPGADAAAQDTFITFQTPSHTIGCGYSRAGGEGPFLRCDLAAVSHRPKRPRSCELDYGLAFGLGEAGPGRRLCVGDTVRDPAAKVLAYGHTRRLGPFTCIARTTGLRCTTGTGHGFELSRERQRLF